MKKMTEEKGHMRLSGFNLRIRRAIAVLLSSIFSLASQVLLASEPPEKPGPPHRDRHAHSAD
jgi:hypothetical protein